jgi:hypothetical protein
MKNKLFLPLLLAPFMLFSSCGLLDDEESTDPEKTLGKPGNIWYGNVDGFPEATLEILENSDGMVTARLDFDNNDFTLKGRITDTSISDFVYSNGDVSKPFTLVRFDAKVGDKWEYNIGNKKVVREVVRKSSTDDVPYGFWMVKTIDVEETIPDGIQVLGYPAGARKIVWKFNHRFGIISAQATMADNSVINVTQTYTTADTSQ